VLSNEYKLIESGALFRTTQRKYGPHKVGIIKELSKIHRLRRDSAP